MVVTGKKDKRIVPVLPNRVPAAVALAVLVVLVLTVLLCMHAAPLPRRFP